MTWITVLLSIISALPEIIGLVIKLIDAIKGIRDKKMRRQAEQELKLAVKEAKRTKSSKPVEELYKKIKSQVN